MRGSTTEDMEREPKTPQNLCRGKKGEAERKATPGGARFIVHPYAGGAKEKKNQSVEPRRLPPLGSFPKSHARAGRQPEAGRREQKMPQRGGGVEASGRGGGEN